MASDGQPAANAQRAGLFGQRVPPPKTGRPAPRQPDRLEPGEILCSIAPERAVHKTLVYRAPEGTGVGERVSIDLGRTPTHGIVVAVGGEELADGVPLPSIRPITDRTGVSIPQPLLELAEWISSYYVAPLGVTLASVLPAAVKSRVGRKRVVELDWATPEACADHPELKPSAADALEKLRAARGSLPATAQALRRDLALRSVRPLTLLREAGVLIERERHTVAVREDPAWAALRATFDAGRSDRVPAPTAEQAAAIGAITAGLGAFGVHLLQGITGSGKTEVYLRVIAETLERGRDAIVLVPEIALTPQTSERFVARFGPGRVAVLHSGMSAARRHAEWARAATGEASVIVGARSAVFAPVRKLGVIVVDEEHDPTYKQDRSPRYHARAVAVKRAQLEGAAVVLGSATPSVETWSLAERGRIARSRLTSRATGAALPAVQIVNVARERRSASASIGPTLRSAIERTLDAGEQVLLLADRRGLSAALRCNSCDWTLRCEACDAAMVVHRGRRAGARRSLRCHHCLAERIVPNACPSCAGRLSTIGAGTQRVEDELASLRSDLVANETFARVDADTMQHARDYFDVLGRFQRGELRLLVGTGMIAKGLDVPGVTLVGVVSADTALAIPDFRCEERTFQLVSQVAGRAGRAGAGRAIVQTLAPEADAIRAAAAHDFEGFAARELGRRLDTGFPPATRLTRIVCRDPNERAASSLAQQVADQLRPGTPPAWDLLGPMPCQHARLADHYRYEVLLRARSAAGLQAALSGLADTRLRSDPRVAVDVDPLHLL